MTAPHDPDEVIVPAALRLAQIAYYRWLRACQESSHPLANAFGVAAIGTTSVLVAGAGVVYLAERGHEAIVPPARDVSTGLLVAVQPAPQPPRGLPPNEDVAARANTTAAVPVKEPYVGHHRVDVTTLGLKVSAVDSLLELGIHINPGITGTFSDAVNPEGIGDATVRLVVSMGALHLVDLGVS